MKSPIFNEISQKLIENLSNNMPQSILITGDYGIGLSEAVRYISSLQSIKPTIILPEKDEKIDIEKGMITVDIIRKIYDDTRTKITKKRIIAIDYAERMTHQAQNAFLKLLEEPGTNTYFILLSHSMSNLLPTILSRTQIIKLRPINHEQSEKLLDELSVADKTKRKQMLFIAEGLPAELSRLASDENYFRLRSQTVVDAREFIRAESYERLKIAHKYKENRLVALQMIQDALNILKRTAISKPQTDVFDEIDKFLDVYERIETNSNIRLALAVAVV